jgi:hypothetical protein
MKKNIILGAGSMVAMLALATSVYATPTDQLRYSINGGAWVVVTDNGAGDTFGTLDNLISIQLTTGPFVGTISTARNIGTAGHPLLDLDLQLAGTGTIVVEYSDIGFQPIPSGAYILHGGVGSQSPGSVNNLYAFVGPNSLYGGTDPVSPSSPFPPTVTPGGTLGPILNNGANVTGTFPGQSNPYSLTIADVYTSPDRGQTAGFISDDTSLTVPDGGNTILMLGAALSVLGFGALRRKAVKA